MQYFLDFLADSSVTSRLHVDSQVTPRLPLENLYIKSIIVTLYFRQLYNVELSGGVVEGAGPVDDHHPPHPRQHSLRPATNVRRRSFMEKRAVKAGYLRGLLLILFFEV